jgi:hypothetical protein
MEFHVEVKASAAARERIETALRQQGNAEEWSVARLLPGLWWITGAESLPQLVGHVQGEGAWRIWSSPTNEALGTVALGVPDHTTFVGECDGAGAPILRSDTIVGALENTTSHRDAKVVLEELVGRKAFTAYATWRIPTDVIDITDRAIYLDPSNAAVPLSDEPGQDETP